MKIISMPRQTGKTTELLKILKENEKAVLITTNQRQADYIWAYAKKNGEDWAERIMDIGMYMMALNRGIIADDAELLIDELDSTLSALLERAVAYAALTEKDKEYDSENFLRFQS